MTRLFVDADACPVKEEVYRVASRYGLEVFVVSNTWIRVPPDPKISCVQVEAGPDAADDWIAERAAPLDIVVTSDIPLARRALGAGAAALRPDGRVFTSDNIGAALASRAVGEHLRSMGEVTSGPRPFGPADRSKFLQTLDALVVKARRARPLSLIFLGIRAAARSRARRLEIGIETVGARPGTKGLPERRLGRRR